MQTPHDQKIHIYSLKRRAKSVHTGCSVSVILGTPECGFLHVGLKVLLSERKKQRGGADKRERRRKEEETGQGGRDVSATTRCIPNSHRTSS